MNLREKLQRILKSSLFRLLQSSFKGRSFHSAQITQTRCTFSLIFKLVICSLRRSASQGGGSLKNKKPFHHHYQCRPVEGANLEQASIGPMPSLQLDIGGDLLNSNRMNHFSDQSTIRSMVFVSLNGAPTHRCSHSMVPFHQKWPFFWKDRLHGR